ncbi:MAG: carbonic anhydrase [Pyrinomonadaceae bacterium]
MKTYDEIFENNRRWAAEKRRCTPDYFQKLAKGQNPEYLYIGCSDSRVTAEEMMGADPGDVFVHRNIANVISNSDLNAMSVIEFAVCHLGVKHVAVCGHYFCGGVAAAMESVDLGLLNPWLRNIRDVYRIHKDELNSIADEERRYKRLVELNVEEQCLNIIKTGAFQNIYKKRGYPIVHGWVFDMETGRLIDLNFDFRGRVEEIMEIYDLIKKE